MPSANSVFVAILAHLYDQVADRSIINSEFEVATGYIDSSAGMLQQKSGGSTSRGFRLLRVCNEMELF